jgi:endoglucanase
MELMLKELQELVSITGPSGFEDDVVHYLTGKLAGLGYQPQVDALGNVLVVKPGASGPRLTISAHADEIGMIVKDIDQNGFLRFEKLGGGDNRILLAQRVWVRGIRGRHLGVIACKSAHLTNQEERGKVVPHQEMYIDLGATSAEEVRAAGIEIGDPISFVSELSTLGLGNERRLIGKGFDDRLGCVMLLRLLRELRDQELFCTIQGIFSSQEEVGLRGAKTASFRFESDVALAVDATAAGDTPDGKGAGLALGKGVGIKVMDFSLIAHRAVKNRLISLAKQQSIPYQLEVLTGIGTDAGAIHQQKGGVATGVISVPNRYTHSPIELVDLGDLEAAYQLLRAFTLSLRPGDNFAFGQ